MRRAEVSSSNVHSVGYDHASGTLEIEFRNGGVYHYHGVPAHLWAGLLQAPSKGQYLHRCIKARGFAFTRVWEGD